MRFIHFYNDKLMWQRGISDLLIFIEIFKKNSLGKPKSEKKYLKKKNNFNRTVLRL